MKLAGAPITWGVCEVPGWGVQLSSHRVLEEVASLGLSAVELGPPGFLEGDGAAVRTTLNDHGLRLAGGFVTAVLHRRALRERTLSEIDSQADMLAAAGADVMVLAAALGEAGYDRSSELGEPEWEALLEALDAARLIGRRHGLETVLHPHYGTAVERTHQVARIVNQSNIDLCIDTGHLMVGGVDPVDAAGRARLAAIRSRRGGRSH